MRCAQFNSRLRSVRQANLWGLLTLSGDDTQVPELSQCYTLRTHMKQALASVLKAVAGIAGLVFLLAPVTDMGILVSVIGLVVAIIAGVASSHLSDDDGQSGYWPKGPSS